MWGIMSTCETPTTQSGKLGQLTASSPSPKVSLPPIAIARFLSRCKMKKPDSFCLRTICFLLTLHRVLKDGRLSRSSSRALLVQNGAERWRQCVKWRPRARAKRWRTIFLILFLRKLLRRFRRNLQSCHSPTVSLIASNWALDARAHFDRFFLKAVFYSQA